MELFIRRYDKKKLFIEKLEKAYSLAQDIYDGYNSEIRNIKSYNPSNKDFFLQNKLHPQKSVNHLKMIFLGYLPMNVKLLEKLSNTITPLNDIINDFDDSITSTFYDLENKKSTIKKLSEHLQELDKVISKIKYHLAGEMKKLV